jgi:hypothetical protein
MEVDMDLTKKTTILFSPALHSFLTDLAKRRSLSLGELIRTACENQYGFTDPVKRLEAVSRLAVLNLPVGDPRELKEQSVPSADDLMP